MRMLFATAALAFFAASPALAECGHQTTAQSKPPVIVAQNSLAVTADSAAAIDETLTGSTVDETFVKKPAVAAAAAD